MFGRNNTGQFEIFWDRMKEDYNPVSTMFSNIKSGPRNYLSRGVGITGVNLTFGIDKGAGMIQFHIRYTASNGKPELLKQFAEFVKQNRQQIESELESELQWSVDYNALSVKKFIPSPGFFADQSTWSGVRKGMVEWMKKFEDVFVPLVQKFKYGGSAGMPALAPVVDDSTSTVAAEEIAAENSVEVEAVVQSADESSVENSAESEVSDEISPTENIEEHQVSFSDDMPLLDEQELMEVGK